MRRIVAVGIAALTLLIALGLLIAGVMRARWESDKARCQNHLREIGSDAIWHSVPPGEAMPEDPASQVPAGTILNPKLDPDQRLAWHVGLIVPLAAKRLVAEELPGQIDPKLRWDAEPQQDAIRTRIPTFLCPAGPPPADPTQPGKTQYVGVSGLGKDAALLPPDNPGAGAFRYDSPTPLALFHDGTQHTIMIGETNHNVGAWAHGGEATLRGVDPDREQFIGIGQPFGGLHDGGGWFAYADGSVRFITESVYRPAFLAQITLNSGDE